MGINTDRKNPLGSSYPTFHGNQSVNEAVTKAGMNIDSDGELGIFAQDGSVGLPLRVSYRNVAASTAHANSTTEALFDTQYSIPAGTLRAGSVVKVRFQGIATLTNATDTLAIKLYVGGLAGTALLTGTATDVANNAIFAGEFTMIVRTAGSSGTMVGYGTHTEVPAASGTAVHDITEVVASTTIDTTVAQVLGVGADWSVANAGNSVRLDMFIVEMAI